MWGSVVASVKTLSDGPEVPKVWGAVAGVQTQEASSRPRGRPSYAPLVSNLPVPGRVVGPASTDDRQGRVSSRRTVPAGGLHRDYLGRNESCGVRFYNQRGMAEQRMEGGKRLPTETGSPATASEPTRCARAPRGDRL